MLKVRLKEPRARDFTPRCSENSWFRAAGLVLPAQNSGLDPLNPILTSSVLSGWDCPQAHALGSRSWTRQGWGQLGEGWRQSVLSPCLVFVLGQWKTHVWIFRRDFCPIFEQQWLRTASTGRCPAGGEQCVHTAYIHTLYTMKDVCFGWTVSGDNQLPALCVWPLAC